MNGSSEHGFVLVSFGAGVKYLSEDIAHKLAGALGRLPQRVVWRYVMWPRTGAPRAPWAVCCVCGAGGT